LIKLILIDLYLIKMNVYQIKTISPLYIFAYKSN